jgi:hypothetical protein
MNKPQVLSHVQFEHIMKRFPTFELSYETVSHKKVSPSYNTCFSIPQGKKCFAWFTFLGEEDVCFVFDLNRDKKISKAYQYTVQFKQPLALGTVVYGTFLEEEKPFFVIEDIFYYKGVSMKHCNMHQKLDFMQDALVLISREFNEANTLVFSLPVFWEIKETTDYELSAVIPPTIINNIGYVPHHLQYRSLFDTAPYINVQFVRPKLTSAPIIRKSIIEDADVSEIVCDYFKPQYNEPTVFLVRADIQFDIYHLYAYNPKNSAPQYYGVACVPNYKTSVMMNSIFRKIRENSNLDYIEESDDDEDFQNRAEDKYVDLEKRVIMTCTFHRKFKKWIPVTIMDKNTRIVMSDRLAKQSYENHKDDYRHRPNTGRPTPRHNGSRQHNGMSTQRYTGPRSNDNRQRKIYA